MSPCRSGTVSPPLRCRSHGAPMPRSATAACCRRQLRQDRPRAIRLSGDAGDACRRRRPDPRDARGSGRAGWDRAARAGVDGYRVGGKTGTTRKSEAGGYSEDRYHSAFAGLAPMSAPRLSVVVVIDEPGGDEYYGGAGRGSGVLGHRGWVVARARYRTPTTRK